MYLPLKIVNYKIEFHFYISFYPNIFIPICHNVFVTPLFTPLSHDRDLHCAKEKIFNRLSRKSPFQLRRSC